MHQLSPDQPRVSEHAHVENNDAVTCAIPQCLVAPKKIKKSCKHGGSRPGSGRPKGSKQVRKLLKSEKSAVALSEGLPSAGIGPIKAREGISPKDLLLTSMRNAWEAAFLKLDEVAELKKDIAVLSVPTDAAAVRRILGLQPEEMFTAARVEIKRAELLNDVTALRIEIGHHLNQARQDAKDIAPYEHPKLANTDSRVAGELTIVLRRFGTAANGR